LRNNPNLQLLRASPQRVKQLKESYHKFFPERLADWARILSARSEI